MRERLLQQLDAARAQHPVVWIAAPAGAGKTTLVASYLQHREVNALWYQVDSGDQDIASFFYYFGLAAKHSGARKKLPLFTAEYQLGLPAFTRNWFRALFAQRSAPTVLVLDNYQEAGETAALHTVLQHAADELPAGVNLMVISRAQPPAELTRLSAANAIATLGWDHLQLTADESAALVQTLTADASTPTPIGTDALQRLHQRTQGWITGVVLGVRRGSSPPSTTNRPVPPWTPLPTAPTCSTTSPPKYWRAPINPPAMTCSSAPTRSSAPATTCRVSTCAGSVPPRRCSSVMTT